MIKTFPAVPIIEDLHSNKLRLKRSLCKAQFLVFPDLHSNKLRLKQRSRSKRQVESIDLHSNKLRLKHPPECVRIWSRHIYIPIS